jgi:hypothetical protein
MDNTSKTLTTWLVVGGLVGCTLRVEASHQDQPEQPHGEYLVGTLNMNVAPSGGMFVNVSSYGVSSFSYQPAPLTLEELKPHDHLVVQTRTEPASGTRGRYELPRLVKPISTMTSS